MLNVSNERRQPIKLFEQPIMQIQSLGQAIKRQEETTNWEFCGQHIKELRG